MKIDKGTIIEDFININKRQYVIPVYQRNYEWSDEQCRKLFADIVTAHEKQSYHFCGSVVYAPLGSVGKVEQFVIIDGQQRLTTIYILIKALMDLAQTDSQREALKESLMNNGTPSSMNASTMRSTGSFSSFSSCIIQIFATWLGGSQLS